MVVEGGLWSTYINTKFKKGSPTQKKAELDLYLEEPIIVGIDTFDILAYRKGCESRCPILAAIAKDSYLLYLY